MTAAVKEKQTSGQGRAVAWDGATMGGAGLRQQMQAIQVCVYCLLIIVACVCWSVVRAAESTCVSSFAAVLCGA